MYEKDKARRKTRDYKLRIRSLWTAIILCGFVMIAAAVLIASTDNWDWLFGSPGSGSADHAQRLMVK